MANLYDPAGAHHADGITNFVTNRTYAGTDSTSCIAVPMSYGASTRQ